MTSSRKAAVVAASVAIGALGVALAPVVSGQSKVLRAQSPKAFEIFTGSSHIGVSVRDLEDTDQKSLKGATAGVVVEEVAGDSPAEKAGIRKGDVVVEFDGERVRSARQLTRLVQETPAGRAVQVIVIREGQRSTMTITPTDRGSSFPFDRFPFGDGRNLSFRIAPTPPSPPPPPAVWRFDEMGGRTSRLGVTVESLSGQLAEYFGIKEGVLVTSVYDDSPAAKAGLKAGDVITSIDGAAVNDPADVRRRVQSLNEGGEFTIGVMRDRKPVTLKGKLERTERRRTSRTIL